MKLAIAILISVISVSLLGCGGGAGSPTPTATAAPKLSKISLSPAAASIHVGENQAFVAQGLDQYHNPMSGITFTWSSSDSSAASAIVHDGLATGLSAGVIYVTASASGVTSASAALTVLAPPPALASILVTPAQPSIFTGGSQQFSAVGKDQYGSEMSGVTFTWSSSNTSIVSINGEGLATGLAAGTATVNASAQGIQGNGNVLTVAKPDSVLTSIAATPATATVRAGSTVQFTVTGFDQFDSPMTGITFQWASSDPTVATVNSLNGEGLNTGIATGIAAGNVAITVSANGKTAPPVYLTVAPAPPVLTSINISPPGASIEVGSTQAYTVTGSDQFGAPISLPPVVWQCASGAATISSAGVATALSAGSAQITATAGGVTGHVFLTITVPPPPPPEAPTVSRLSPPIALTGKHDLTNLTIAGRNFGANAVVNFGSEVLVPVSISDTSITVTVPAAELQAPSSLLVSVSNPEPGAATSNALPFTITDQGFVSIDFDDGYQSMYDNGLPIFDAAGIRTTQYIITGGFQPENNGAGCGCMVGVGADGYVTWDEVRTMAAHGHEIGAHTQTHQPLSLLTPEQQTAEIAGSKQDLIAQGLAPLTFAYPYGDYGYPNGSIGMTVQNSGYLGARDSDLGYNGCHSGHGQPEPYYLWSEAGETDYNTTLDNLTGFIDYAVTHKLWLIVLLHRVDDNAPGAAAISISSALLQGMVDHIVNQHVNVVTNSEGLTIENLNGQTSTFTFPQ
ncbi:MAG: Ig-like domain-containing protein [Terriglobales bacterium]